MSPDPKTTRYNVKRLFLKLGTCAQTYFHILNREYGHPLEAEERAVDPLAGGILQQGYQCGMLWGAALAVGAEAHRRSADVGEATGLAITATQSLLESFSLRARTHDCYDITDCNWSSKLSMAKYMLSGRFLGCFDLADRWVPEAIQAAADGLACKRTDWPPMPISCASEVARRLGASDAETLMVAGFAGGLGLSGNACGALAAAIWLDTLAWCRRNPGKSGYSNPNGQSILEAFYAVTDYEILCHKVSGQRFATVDAHAVFTRSGGCDKVIDALARSQSPTAGYLQTQ